MFKKMSLKFLLSLVIAFIFLQSMFFKFTGAPETIYIFSTLGAWSGFDWFADYGAYMVGTAEIIASILLFSRWHALGALMSLGVISGAIFFHLFTPLGVQMPEFNAAGEVIGNDGGTLFIMACVVWLCAFTLVVKDYRDPQGFFRQFLGKDSK